MRMVLLLVQGPRSHHLPGQPSPWPRTPLSTVLPSEASLVPHLSYLFYLSCVYRIMECLASLALLNPCALVCAAPWARNVLPSSHLIFLEVLSMSRVAPLWASADSHSCRPSVKVTRHPLAFGSHRVPLLSLCATLPLVSCHSQDPTGSLGIGRKQPHRLLVLGTMPSSQETFKSVCSKTDQRNQAENPECTNSLQGL